MATKDQQLAEVVEGLGLGLLSLGTDRVTSSKIDLESAISHAWGRWAHSSAYPSVGRAHKPANEVWIRIGKSRGRRSAAVVWIQEGAEYVIAIGLGDWTPEETVDLVGERSLSDWEDLASLFLEWLERFPGKG